MTQSLSEFVAAEVRAQVARQNLSHRSIAEVLGMSPAVLSDRMRGVTEFRLSELEKIADHLGVPLSAFMPATTETASAA